MTIFGHGMRKFANEFCQLKQSIPSQRNTHTNLTIIATVCLHYIKKAVETQIKKGQDGKAQQRHPQHPLPQEVPRVFPWPPQGPSQPQPGIQEEDPQTRARRQGRQSRPPPPPETPPRRALPNAALQRQTPPWTRLHHRRDQGCWHDT
mmetsp:Transcript_6545/g.9706  ORF Transcript_6545/g.9706 Transcript_6545/m.9706 type:complete len:148 (-) Transcript_6545:41-484(-)